MGSHPLNLIFRFLLEIAALLAVASWGWNKTDSFYKFVYAIGLPVLLAIIWGTFAVPNDPSRSGKTIINTPGSIRLVIELVIFTLSTLALFVQGHQKISYVFACVVIAHYLVSYDRVLWLLKN